MGHETYINHGLQRARYYSIIYRQPDQQVLESLSCLPGNHAVSVEHFQVRCPTFLTVTRGTCLCGAAARTDRQSETLRFSVTTECVIDKINRRSYRKMFVTFLINIYFS